MMSRDGVVGVGNGISISVPVARDQEIQRIQQLIRFARNFRRAIPHAIFAIRSILVRRTKLVHAAKQEGRTARNRPQRITPID
jgi:hypothetical protein